MTKNPGMWMAIAGVVILLVAYWKGDKAQRLQRLGWGLVGIGVAVACI